MWGQERICPQTLIPLALEWEPAMAEKVCGREVFPGSGVQRVSGITGAMGSSALKESLLPD